ncbi:MAG: lysophospholipid acyltransferase family protein [Alcanivoracaceae bacterium]|nr:lysophospholipid acyltransferase family protein [Alcanivoracaceae bacterium]
MTDTTQHTASSLHGMLAVLGIRLLGALPLRWIQTIGAAIGALLWHLRSRDQHVTLVNLEKCFPEMEHQERELFGHRALVENAQGMAELAWVWRHPAKALAITHGHHTAFDEALSSQQPVIILAPHLGCWEVLNYWLASKANMHAMFMPSGVEQLDQLVRHSRESLGSTMHPATARGVASLVRAMRKEHAITAILPDQVAEPNAGMFADFFQVPAWTATLSSKLIQQTGARVFMAFAKRLPKGQGYQVIMHDPDPDIYSSDLQVSLNALNRSIESLIDEAPEQYLWSYKRFRVRPTGVPDPYKTPKKKRSSSK